jgi:hypothetical protein
MLLWYVGTAVLAVWFVFRDPRFDYRLLLVGSVLPPLVDVWFGGARVLHSLVFSVVLMALVMAISVGRRSTRRMLLGLPLGTLLYLVFSGAWADTTVFWWPFSGGGFDDTPLPMSGRGVWNVVLEVIGLALVVWIARATRLRSAASRHHFLSTGQLVFVTDDRPVPRC